MRLTSGKLDSIFLPINLQTTICRVNEKQLFKQAGTELGQAQLQLELDFTCLLANLHSYEPAFIGCQTFL